MKIQTTIKLKLTESKKQLRPAREKYTQTKKSNNTSAHLVIFPPK